MKIQNKADVVGVLEENKKALQNCGVKRVGIFGSFVRGEQTDKSDIDLLVEFVQGKKTYKNYIKFAELSENLLGRDVDVLTPEFLSPYLAPHIKKEISYVQIA